MESIKNSLAVLRNGGTGALLKVADGVYTIGTRVIEDVQGKFDEYKQEYQKPPQTQNNGNNDIELADMKSLKEEQQEIAQYNQKFNQMVQGREGDFYVMKNEKPQKPASLVELYEDGICVLHKVNLPDPPKQMLPPDQKPEEFKE